MRIRDLDLVVRLEAVIVAHCCSRKGTEKGSTCSGIWVLRQHRQPPSAKRARGSKCGLWESVAPVHYSRQLWRMLCLVRVSLASARLSWQAARTIGRAILRHCLQLALLRFARRRSLCPSRTKSTSRPARPGQSTARKEDLQVRVSAESAVRVAFHDMTNVSERQ